MKKIIAKLKNDQNVTVFPDAEIEGLKDVYKIPKITLAIPFEVDTRALAEGEWYFVVLTEEEKEEMLGGYVSESSGALLEMISPDHYTEIKALYAVAGAEILFTKVTSRQVARSQKYIAFNEKPEVVQQGNTLVLTGQVDAYWNGSLLYFKKFTFIRSLFPGIHKMYKQITEEGTNAFLSSPMFELQAEMSSDVIGLGNRRKIVSIVLDKTIDLNDPITYGKYLTYAMQYDLGLEIESGKIALINNTDIGKVISLLSEKFYTTEVTGEKREIRTSRKLAPAKKKQGK